LTFSEFVGSCDRIRRSSSKNEKVAILAEYLKTLDDESLKIVCMFLSGHMFPRSSGLDLNIGYSAVWDVLRRFSSLKLDELRKIYIKHGDLGELAEQAIAKRKIEPLLRTELTLN